MANFLMMGVSLRKASFNKKLIKNAHRILTAESKNSFELVPFNDYPMPVYDGDLEEQQGIPDTVKELAKIIYEADGIIFSTPEYNGSIPGPFKNAIDWVSRVQPSPWAQKHVLLIGATPGALGAIRGLWHSRVPLEALGCYVYPEMMGLPNAAKAFNEVDQLIDSGFEERLKKLLIKYDQYVSRQK